MPWFRRFALLLCLLLWLLPPAAALADSAGPGAPALLEAAASDRAVRDALAAEAGGAVTAVIDGDTLTLADGREIRLVGIQAPKLPLGRPGFEAWPLAEEARQALEALTLGRRVELGFGGRRGDRHGRVLAHLFDSEGHWIQGALLHAGLARVYSFADNRAAIPQMLALERAARAAGRGIWGHAFYAVRRAEEAGRFLGGFELVEGRVIAVGRGGGKTYLNFAEDWRQDFTIAIDRRAERLFAEQGIDLDGYAGKSLRVRGWLKERNGPMIEVTHPEQIEELDD
ncbi:MAG: thermonuclease family protein [Kiloniellaceae bacterium]